VRSILFIFAVLAGLFLACRSEARAALHVCDGTDQPATVAIAALVPSASGAQATSEGWFQIDSGTCQTVIDTDLNPGGTTYYLFAKARTITWAGSSAKASQDAQFCTNDASGFAYVDRSPNNCNGAAELMRWFINEPIGGADWTITLDWPT